MFLDRGGWLGECLDQAVHAGEDPSDNEPRAGYRSVPAALSRSSRRLEAQVPDRGAEDIYLRWPKPAEGASAGLASTSTLRDTVPGDARRLCVGYPPTDASVPPIAGAP
jgi:hypothetical protein